MLMFSHPREVTEKSVRRGEDTCLIHFFFKTHSLIVVFTDSSWGKMFYVTDFEV